MSQIKPTLNITTFSEPTLLYVYRDLTHGGEPLASVLYGIVIDDETRRFATGFRVITSPVVSILDNETTFITKSDSTYRTQEALCYLKIALTEWYLMRAQTLSPQELLRLRAYCVKRGNSLE
jgi:hypothetical protein